MTVTAVKEDSGRSFYLVDTSGGALSSLAAGVARGLGIEASAATTSPRVDVPGEIAKVLEEVGMRLPDARAELHDAGTKAAGREVVFLGREAPSGLAGAQAWDVALYQGNGELERLSAARIARDEIERRLELARSRSSR